MPRRGRRSRNLAEGVSRNTRVTRNRDREYDRAQNLTDSDTGMIVAVDGSASGVSDGTQIGVTLYEDVPFGVEGRWDGTSVADLEVSYPGFDIEDVVGGMWFIQAHYRSGLYTWTDFQPVVTDGHLHITLVEGGGPYIVTASITLNDVGAEWSVTSTTSIREAR